MNLGAILSGMLVALAGFFLCGLAIQGRLEEAVAGASGMARVALLPLELRASLSQLATHALTK